jgi:hypothetical protein
MRKGGLAAALMLLSTTLAAAAETPIPQAWEYSAAMRQMTARFQGREGVVLHVGDSITYANPYGAWARAGSGKTADDQAALAWMHTGADNDTDGWWLARFDHPDGRSHTACGGIRADEMLAGGKANLPPFEKLLAAYRPQMVVLMLGTNDASAGRRLEDYRADMAKAVELMLTRGIIPILSTIPPHVGRPELARSYNDALRALARSKQLPLIDFEAEILKRRPNDWDGTLLGKEDLHPTASQGGATPNSPPTSENLRNSGYLLRGWLSVEKIAEVKRAALDGKPPAVGSPESAEPAKPEPAEKAAAAETLKLPVTRDTYFSDVGKEAAGNLGGSPQLKVKSMQEMSLLDVDPQPLVGRTIRSATLHAFGQDFKRITVGSFGAEWVEGTSRGYEPQTGSSSFQSARHPDVPWTRSGGDLCAVILAQGGTLWRMADAQPDAQPGWQRVAIDPAVLAARVAGLSYGLLVFDDTGTEWQRDGERWTMHLFPNRYFKSREGGAATAPYLTVAVGEPDLLPPAEPTDFQADITDLPAGELRVSWLTPADQGPAGTLGFRITVNAKEAPRYLIPLAGKSGRRVTMHLRDLDLPAGGTAKLAVQAVDAAGNLGPAAQFSTQASALVAAELPGKRAAAAPNKTAGPLPRLGDCQIAILDMLDKVQPITGELIPPQPEGYLNSNHLWNAGTRRIELEAAKNEFLGFQILVRGKTAGIRAKLDFEDISTTRPPKFMRYAHVQSAKGPLPDPLVTFDDAALAIPSPDENIAGQQSDSLLCEILIPHDAKPGRHAGRLSLTSAEGALELQVQLTVYDFTLPDHLSFLPEMNCYGLPDNEQAYYRLAHEHRTVLNRVPYHQNGSVEDGCAPGWDGKQLDWTRWDKRFAPLLDGSAFADLPRASVPVECFYLPIQENWPNPMAENYHGGYWADQAFPPAYRQALVDVSRQMAQHFDKRAWRQTLFHFFLNGKNNFKAGGWSRGSSPWLLDEPANLQDYWALSWFGQAFHQGVSAAGGQAKLVFRCDISRPEWQRDTLDAVLDYNVVGGGAFRKYRRMVLDRRREFGQIVVEYGSSNAIDQSNMQPVGWALESWSLESDGILPWQTIGNAAAWKQANTESLFYPARSAGEDPAPSIRLKAYRRGQQDVEYLTLLARQTGQPRWAVGQRVRAELGLAAQREGTGFVGGEDAGVITFANLLPQNVAALRRQIGAALSAARPPAKAQLVEFHTSLRDGRPAAPGYVAGFEVKPDGEPASADPAAAEATIVLQGRGVVTDTLIDFAAPEKNFGSEPRNNALRRADQCNAFLVRCDLRQASAPANSRLKRARLSFYVWDPSSAGKTKIVAARVLSPWDEASATWKRPASGSHWAGAIFEPTRDTTHATAPVVVQPDAESDTAEPPIEYQLDVTALVAAWLGGTMENYGFAIVPVIDRAVDDGYQTRFQIYGSEASNAKLGPKLLLEFVRE